MAYDFQVTVDCADPHVLAEWWGETLEWPVEEQDEAFIKDMVAKGFATEAETKTFKGKLVWATGAAIRHPELLASGTPLRVLFQYSADPKTVKDRIHLDVRVGAERRDAVKDALIARGATFLWSASQGPHSWHTLADIEGNEFCVS